jgi:2-polyprenyl-3-methyl-5-hydroxy-6-metoxy-1,4-benzoquinol methylase
MAKPDRLLEIGCSLGLFTRLLTGWAKNALITDIAPTATAKTEANMATVDPKGTLFTYETASGTAEFAPANHFDIITLMDVMESVSDVPQIQYDMMHNMMRMVKPSGFILLTDYLHPKTFEKTKDKYRSWGLEIVECHYLNDRLFYNLRTNFKSISKSWPLRNLLASTQFAKVLRSLSSLMGKKGSKHLFLVMRKTSL